MSERQPQLYNNLQSILSPEEQRVIWDTLRKAGEIAQGAQRPVESGVSGPNGDSSVTPQANGSV